MAETTSTSPATAVIADNAARTTNKRTTWKIEAPIPADVPRIVDVQWNAQSSARMHSLFPHTESGRRYSERDYLRNVTQPKRPAADSGRPPPPETLMRVVRERQDGPVVAFGMWRHLRVGDDWGWRAAWSPFDDIPDMSYEVAEGIFRPARRAHMWLMEGREHLSK